MDNVIIYDKLEELNEGIESNGGGITSLLGKGCVKSVQRGIWTGKQSIGASQSFTIASIAAVNVGKSFLIVNATTSNYKGESGEQYAYVLSSTSLAVKNTGAYNQNSVSLHMVDWQVIEFY